MPRIAALLIVAALAAGCESSSENSSFSAGTGSPSFTLNCPSGLQECHQLAREACGTAGYRQVRNPGERGYSTAGSGDSRTEELLSRGDRRTATQTWLTVECRAPRQP
ncbi:MAG: hypothetical protein AAFX10_15125 [Pseudomonadota bacterium]